MKFFKKKVIKEIDGVAWGHLVNDHGVDVDTLTKLFRWVERNGFLDNRIPVKFLRIFDQTEVQQKGIVVTGWETFDEHPDLVHFEGYMTNTGGTETARLERKRSKVS